MYNDPSGEFAFLAPILGNVVAGIIKGAVIGAVIGGASYTIGLAVSGNIHQWKFGGMLKSMAWGAVSGAITAGIGEIFTTSTKIGEEIVRDLSKFAKGIEKSAGKLGLVMVQGGTHAIAQGVLSLMQGGNFVHGAVAGFAGHLGAEAWGGAMKGMGYEQFAQSTGGMVVFGALSGGIGAELSGGNFWQGAVTGGIVAGLNSAMHKLGDGNKNNKKGPPYEYNGNKYNTKEELYRAILIHQASEQFGIVDIIALMTGGAGYNIIPTRGKFSGATPNTSINSIVSRKITLSIKKASRGTISKLPTLTGGPFTGQPIKVAMVNTVGKFLGRTLGPVGWGILAYDVGKTLYNTQTIYNRITNEN